MDASERQCVRETERAQKIFQNLLYTKINSEILCDAPARGFAQLCAYNLTGKTCKFNVDFGGCCASFALLVCVEKFLFYICIGWVTGRKSILCCTLACIYVRVCLIRQVVASYNSTHYIKCSEVKNLASIVLPCIIYTFHILSFSCTLLRIPWPY